MKTKNDFIRYANSFQTVINLGLGRVLKLLDCCGNPHEKLKVIHVAGTNGKGSVCAFLQAVCTAFGLKTGKFISPNMLKVNERISIDGVDISDEDMERLLLKIEGYIQEVEAHTGEVPTQFEIWTAAAFCYFFEHKCDVVILETGLGGRFDATNVVSKPIASIITRIAKDHVALLGDTLSQIAYEKAGIIKHECPLITLPQDDEVLSVLEREAQRKNSRVILTKEVFMHSPENCFETFSYDGMNKMTCGISGLHQVENASLAIEAAKLLGIPESIICEGIQTARHIGRLEHFNGGILFDGAHNYNGMQSLKKSLDRYYPQSEKIFIAAFMKDKEIEKSLAVFQGEEFYFTKVKNNERCESPEKLCEKGKNAGVLCSSFETLETALAKARHTGKQIVVCGSLYLYQDLYELVKKEDKNSVII